FAFLVANVLVSVSGLRLCAPDCVHAALRAAARVLVLLPGIRCVLPRRPAMSNRMADGGVAADAIEGHAVGPAIERRARLHVREAPKQVAKVGTTSPRRPSLAKPRGS